jgi:hypothetical protein
MFLLTLFGCLLGNNNTEFYENLECSHPTSPFEARIVAEVEDVEQWSDILVEVAQGQTYWSADMKNVGENQWYLEMMLMELDCSTEYFYNFTYIIRE